MARQIRIDLEQDRCKGCELCVQSCPRHVLQMSAAELNQLGYRPAQVAHPDRCNGCTICALVCPEVAFTLYEAVPELAGVN